MSEYIIIPFVALLGSGLTLFSGFGLGTLLVPVFGLFFSIDLAIALTAIVHFLNNVFKLVLVGNHANKSVVLKFGIPSIIAAFIGALLLAQLSDLPSIATHHFLGKICIISPIKLLIAIVLIVFALFEAIPRFKNLQFDEKYLPLGGLLSGFFGGLSGNQGALRSAFLTKANLSKESFIATGVVIACMVDVSRLSLYSKQIYTQHQHIDYTLIIIATLAAFLGAYIGNKLLKKVTIHIVQTIVTIMLIIFAVLLGLGII